MQSTAFLFGVSLSRKARRDKPVRLKQRTGHAVATLELRAAKLARMPQVGRSLRGG